MIAGIRMNRRQKSFFNSEFFIDNISDRPRAIRGTGGCVNYRVAFILAVIYSANDTLNTLAFRRGGDYNFFRAGLKVQARFFFSSERSGAFQNRVYSQFLPRQPVRLSFRVNFNFLSINNQMVAVIRHFFVVP